MKKMFMTTMLMSFFFLTLSFLMLYKNSTIMLEFNFTKTLMMYFTFSSIMDWPATMFISSVLMISSMIMLFSNNYITNQEINRFMLIMMTFIMSMILLIMSNNLMTLILGWDGLGFSSYILVAYYQNFTTSASSTITIMSNRIGDVALMLVISMTLLLPKPLLMTILYPKMSLILIMLASITKSAQFPFSAWLPAAMAAPTPISALVHSSTLVTAGVYLLIRTNSTFHPIMSKTLLILATFTILMASLVANWEQDLKKIIALSTLSQIAMMMFSISIKAFNLAYFHLITHAMFKSTMFMCAGIMINVSSYQDIRKTKHFYSLPTAFITLSIVSMALMGLPFSSGFYSKHTIMENMMFMNMNVSTMIMTMSVGLTSCYTLRLITLSGYNFMKTNPDLHSPNNQINTPIMIMTPISIFLGAMLQWLMFPEKIFIINPILKMSTNTSMAIGMMLGLFLQFKNSTFTKMSEMSISLWYSHYLTTHSLKFINMMNSHNQKNDKLWMEMLGPQNIHSSMTTFSKKINNLLIMTIVLIVMSLVTPIL